MSFTFLKVNRAVLYLCFSGQIKFFLLITDFLIRIQLPNTDM